MQWTESVGLTLVSRDLASMQLRSPSGQLLTFSVLQTFPFTSESKRMGIIVRVAWSLVLPRAGARLGARPCSDRLCCLLGFETKSRNWCWEASEALVGASSGDPPPTTEAGQGSRVRDSCLESGAGCLLRFPQQRRAGSFEEEDLGPESC